MSVWLKPQRQQFELKYSTRSLNLQQSACHINWTMSMICAHIVYSIILLYIAALKVQSRTCRRRKVWKFLIQIGTTFGLSTANRQQLCCVLSYF